MQNILIERLTATLHQGTALVERLDDEKYIFSEKCGFVESTSVGAHFRHCVEFIDCFLSGVGIGQVDYDARVRTRRVENDRDYAVASFHKTIGQLARLRDPGEMSHPPLLVKPEDSPDGDLWCPSSIERELEFLTSHTIHHYALIGFKLQLMGIVVPSDFGVAPSTLRFWDREAA